MPDSERPPIVVSPFVEYRAKCELQGCIHPARAIMRYPDLALPIFRQVCLCGAHTIRAMAKALDADLKIREEGKIDFLHPARSS
jgi:hypothetical protein